MNPIAAMEDGQIEPGSERGDLLGYSADVFAGWLWKRDGAVIISFIHVLQPGQGHFKAIVSRILESGCAVQIPTPMGLMELIVRKWGFTQAHVFDETYGEHVEVWTKQPPQSVEQA